jgi:hypothetical protein
MSLSDLFAESPSTHHLLLGLLLAETGLLGAGPASQENQHSWLVSSFPGLQSRLAAAEWDAVAAIHLLPFQDMDVSRRDDARLFLKLYRGINSLADLGVPASKQVELVAYPLVREMIESRPDMHAILSAAYQEHAAQHGGAVASRIRGALTKCFDLESIANEQSATQPESP